MTFEQMEPKIWRRVILPAGATFNRLHEIIQRVTNFQSFFMDEPYHFFEMEVDGMLVTNNDAMHEEYGKSKVNGLVLKRPSRLKIDGYLEKKRQLLYRYDSGDDWRILVELEDIVDDYYFGFPTLLDGEGTAPPEDVGGPPGYEQFLKSYHDSTHPDHEVILAWATGQQYRAYDPDFLNDMLKFSKYQKTEWDKINHQNYEVLSDKYRGSSMQKNVEEKAVPEKDVNLKEQHLLDYIVACTNLYGIVPMEQVLEIYNKKNNDSITFNTLSEFVSDTRIQQQLEARFVYIEQDTFVAEALIDPTERIELRKAAEGKPFYIPDAIELLRYVDDHYYERTPAQEKLKQLLKQDFGTSIDSEEEVHELVVSLQISGGAFTTPLSDFLQRLELPVEKAQRYIGIIIEIANTTRLWENRGFTPEELQPYEQERMIATASRTSSKVRRNEPCPCGSGKKYKKCCG